MKHELDAVHALVDGRDWLVAQGPEFMGIARSLNELVLGEVHKQVVEEFGAFQEEMRMYAQVQEFLARLEAEDRQRRRRKVQGRRPQ